MRTRKLMILGLVFFLGGFKLALAAEPDTSSKAQPQTQTKKKKIQGATFMKEVLVQAPKGVFLPDFSGPKIYAGKETISHSLSNVPAVQADQYRRVFSQLPGVLVSELSVPSIVNLSYRGLNDPHE